MASINREPGGRRTIQFVAGDGRRRSIRLGKVTQRMAEAVKLRVELLSAAIQAGHAVDDETARWLATIDDRLNAKLAAVGLAAIRQTATMAAFLDSYITSRGDVKGSTGTVYGHTRRCLVEYFGASKPLRDITPGDADKWRLWLVTHEKLAENTVRRRSGIAKQFFKAAARQRLVSQNPFADLTAAVKANPSRYHYVTVADADKVLAVCPDAEWRLLFALSRYGGLRCPSEHLGLRWGDVDWEKGRLRVASPKTEHHEGGASREVPLFPELRPHLEAAWDEAKPGAEYIITRYRDTNSNLRTQLNRIIRRAGLKPWPKLFQNLRSTRETELVERFPLHKVCAWIGNSQLVAAKHYLQVTDEHFEEALKPAIQPEVDDAKESAAEQAVQNPVQSAAESSRVDSHSLPSNPEFSGKPADSRYLQVCQVGDEGLEPPTSTV